jgi:hypothetical protein
LQESKGIKSLLREARNGSKTNIKTAKFFYTIFKINEIMPTIVEDDIETITDAILFEILKQLTRIADLKEQFIKEPYINSLQLNRC